MTIRVDFLLKKEVLFHLAYNCSLKYIHLLKLKIYPIGYAHFWELISIHATGTQIAIVVGYNVNFSFILKIYVFKSETNSCVKHACLQSVTFLTTNILGSSDITTEAVLDDGWGNKHLIFVNKNTHNHEALARIYNSHSCVALLTLYLSDVVLVKAKLGLN